MAWTHSAYVKTTTAVATRNRDQLSWAFTARPQAMTVYVRVRLLGIQAWSADYALVQIGSNAASNPRCYLASASATTFVFTYHNGVSSVAPSVTHTASRGDVVEVRGTLTAAGVAQVSYAANGGAETTGSAASALVLPTAWASQHLMVNSAGTIGVNHLAYRALWVGRGIHTLDACRRFAGTVPV